jgi:hypothetical protein
VRAIVGLLLIACFDGCAASGSMSSTNVGFNPLAAADAAVDNFHVMADDEAYSDIYIHASETLKKSTTENDWSNLLHSIRVTVGTAKSTQRIKSSMKKEGSKNYIDVLYDSVFTDGELKEEFIYEISNTGVLLAGYHVFGQTN